MTVAELLQLTFKLFQQNLALLVSIALLPEALLLGAELLISARLPSRSAVLVLLVMALILRVLVLSAVTVSVAGCVLGYPPTLRQTYSLTLRNGLLRVVLVQLTILFITGSVFMLVFAPALKMGVGIALLLGSLPALVLGSYLSIALPIAVLEALLPFQAISRAFQLMRPELGKGISIFSFALLISGILPLILQWLLGQSVLSSLLGAVAAAVTLPLGYTGIVLLYLSLRSREGYTLERLGDELAQRVNSAS